MKASTIQKEIIFQIIFHVVAFGFYVHDRNEATIPSFKYVYFLNYAFFALIINYICLPFFYKKKNILLFSGMVIVCITLSALVEEFLLEPIFFTGQRAETVKLLGAIIDITPVIAILTGVKFAWDAVNKQREVDKLEGAVKESQLQYLKSQINPHFLFNNMNNIYAYALEGSEKTPEIILELSGLLRYMLYECKERFVPLNKEIEHLKNFINLYKLQIEDRGIVNFSLEGLLKNQKLAPLVLIVFVENAFKHSQSSQSSGIKIDVRVKIEDDDKLYFSCKNSFDEGSNVDKLDKGIGLQNVKKRLELIYPNAHSLEIKDDNNMYHVDLSIDLNKGLSA